MTATFILLSIILTTIDILQTNTILSLGGIEKNPIQRYFMTRLRRVWWLPKMFITLCLLIVLVVFDLEFALIGFLIVQLAVVLWNVKVYREVKKRGDSTKTT